MATKVEIIEFLARELPNIKCRVEEVGNALFKNSIVTLNFHDMTLDVQAVSGG